MISQLLGDWKNIANRSAMQEIFLVNISLKMSLHFSAGT